MWKLLRNSVLVVLVIAGVLKLVLWYEIQQGGSRLKTQLAPIAQLQYESVSATLGGNVQFSGVSIAFSKDPHESWRAASIDLTTPGPLWLARRLLLGDDSFPSELVANVSGLQAPATAFAPLGTWLSPLSLVPFETQGCGVVSRFSVADYQRMGINPGLQQQRFEYRYDPVAATLSVAANVRAPPFSNATLRAELQQVTPQVLAAGDWRKLRASEIHVSYGDNGYLARRNRFCAQQAGIDPAQFVAQHVGAVRDLIAKYGVEASAEVMALYRGLVQEGGRVSILSLPAAGASLGEILADAPDATVRRLNLTARRNEAPPVMVRLAFHAPPDTPAVAAADSASPAEAAPTAIAPAAAPVAAAPPAAPPAPTVASHPTPTPPTPAPPPATASGSVASAAPAHPAAAGVAPARDAVKPAAVPPAASTAAPPVAAKPLASPAPPKPAAVASAPPKPAAVASPPAAVPAQTAATGATSLLPSGPQPPPNSTLALVWKPTLDRLEETPPPPRDYDVVDYAALSGYSGRFVRVLTTTGKKIEGRVIAVDGTTVALRIQQPGGSAELQVARSIIFEIQLPRARGDRG